ncbi:hypothetical protein WJX84_012115 [Apatococcus fuscideae]|uniref:Acetyl-coenzyme A synthetase n=1 Tax=Apatococcus fuscideae TaxID=2026836 RepID=A0AAW1TH67_9CHLO
MELQQASNVVCTCQRRSGLQGQIRPSRSAGRLSEAALNRSLPPKKEQACRCQPLRAVQKTMAAAVEAPVLEAPAVDYKHSLLAGREDYDKMYKRSIEDPAGFWGDIAKGYHWEQQWEDDHHNHNFDVAAGRISTEFFKGGRTNIAYNCLDRHVQEGRGDVDCLLWEANDPGTDRRMTYSETLAEVCRLANWLRAQGIKKGDAVAIYMPMLCELPIAMLACARIGAVHSVIFAGFSPESIASRIQDCKARVVLAASAVKRGKKAIDLKSMVDKALDVSSKEGFEVKKCLVCHNASSGSGKEVTHMKDGRDVWWDTEIPSQKPESEVEWVHSEDPLFLLYTSGSTGKPKGVLHSTGGYMVMAGTTSRYVFDLQPGDVYWCTADCGWITGHTYLTYGPLLCGATNVVFEGTPTYPTPARSWQVVEKFKVKQYYTAPTLIRSLLGSGNEHVTAHDRSSLKILGTVGEPINPEAWKWYSEVVGEGKLPIVDTWWQTETGAHMITPLPGVFPAKPGSATLPFFGVAPAMVNEHGHEIQGPGEGYLCIKQAWPSTIRTIFGDHDRYETTYFAGFKGLYFSGDGCRRDEDGYYWITGRVDDVINVSGHRIGTAEVESALTLHPKCAEAAVVGYEHPIKGQGIYAYVSLREGEALDDALKKELVMTVRGNIGAFAAPDVVHWAPGLLKTRSGKIMRRVLRKIASKEESQLGDTSTLADPGVVDQLLSNRP